MNKVRATLLVIAAFAATACSTPTKSSSFAPASTSAETTSEEEKTSVASVESQATSEAPIVVSSSEEPQSTEPTIDPQEKAKEFFSNRSFGEEDERPSTLDDFTPSRFSGVKVLSEDSLGDGVTETTYSLTLSNGKNSQPHVVSVDLDKASIRTTNSQTIDTVATQIDKFESTHDTKVMAGVNADFFATGTGGSSVNAYVKDSKIIKAGHNDNGVYDYTNTASDVPASNPMLLGVSGNKARVGAIVNGKNKEETIKSKFSYKVYATDASGDGAPLDGTTVFNSTSLDGSDYDLIVNGSRYTSSEGDIDIKIKLAEDDDSSFQYGTIDDVEELEAGRIATSLDLADGYVHLFARADIERDFQIGEMIGWCIDNDDHTWTGYNNIIGGRQSLVEKGEIASTVTKENTNGAQRADTPRTCAGVGIDGTVYVCAVEALRYGGVSSSTSDPYGMTLPELAEFMRYIGCYDALNFDGGGSTQLITSNDNGNGTKKMSIRCSDGGTTSVSDTRKVYSTLLVTTK